MDRKLASCVTSLKQEAESARGGFVVDLKPLVDDLRDLCKELVEAKDVAVACALVLEEDGGLFSAVESLMPIRDREAQKGREAILDFLAGFIRQIGQRALPCAGLIKEKSLKIFIRDDSKSVQASSLTLLITLFELGILKPGIPNFTVDYRLAQLLLKEFRRAKTSSTLKCNILVLLGYLVEFFPSSFTHESVGEILKLCLDIFENSKTKDPAYILVTGATKCLDSLLTWFDDSVPAGGSVENSKCIFECLQQLLRVREDLKRYEVVKGLHFLSRHAPLFRLRLLENGMTILDYLQFYCTHNNAALRDAGIAAYDKFMTEIGSSLVSDDGRIQNAQLTYRSFMKHTIDILDSEDSHHKLVAVAIRALGKLSPAIVKYSGTDSLKQAFQKLVPFGTRATDAREESLGYSVILVKAFADIIFQLDEVEDFIVTVIAEVVGSIFYQFPNLFRRQRPVVYESLQNLFKALYSKGTIFTLFVNNIVWSSLERATEPTEALTTEVSDQLWRHYVDLWSNVLDFDPAEAEDIIDGSDQSTEQDAEQDIDQIVASTSSKPVMGSDELQEAVFDTVIRCTMRSVVGLNIKYRVKQTSSQPAAVSHTAKELAVMPDIAETGNEPEAEMDIVEPLDRVQMQKFLNLVEFTQDFLYRCKPPLFLKWTYTFGQCLIELSSRYPLISGFYKLVAVTINTADKGGFFGNHDGSEYVKSPVSLEDQQLCKELLQSYLEEVVVASRRYKLELFAACLCLCLSSPPGLMRISSLVAPIQNALRIGLRYNPLALVAIDALERWYLERPDDLQLYLDQIVPGMTDYLIEVEVSERTDDLERRRRPGSNKKTLQLGSTKHVGASGTGQGPYQFTQVRVQQFLGRIGRYAHHLVSDFDLRNVPGSTGLSWDSGDRVKFVLPFRDVKPDVWLDSLLPRIVELGLSSSDRRTKITACELLHAVCLLMLGNSAKGPLQKRNGDSVQVQYDKLYRKLFPAILQLATDVDLVTRQIFQVFSKQLIHWLTSNVNRENPDTMALLDSILDGLVQPENGSLREFSAECFAEFLHWSIRHTSVEADNIVNVTSMLRRICNRLDHPNAYHRLGAAMATHRMYPVLRQNSSVVERYILELSYYAVKSLHLAENDNEQIGTVKQLNRTLWYLEKLIKQTIVSLQDRKKHRPIFKTIEEFLEWLFTESGRIQENCRIKCMSMFCSLCQSLPVGSARGWFLLKVGTSNKSLEALVVQFDSDQKLPAAAASVQDVNVWLSSFTRSLHWFTWALKEKMLGIEIIRKTRFVCKIPSFLERLSSEPEIVAGSNSLTPGERGLQASLKLSAIAYFLQFGIEVFLLEKPETASPDKFRPISNFGESSICIMPASDSRFHRWLALLVVRPWEVGFVASDGQKSDELAKLLITMLNCGSSAMRAGVIDYLRQFVGETTRQDLIPLSLSTDDGDVKGLADLKHLLKGLLLMQRAGIIGMCLEKARALEIGEQLIMAVFNLQRECPPALEPVALNMLAVSRALGVGMEKLLVLVLDERPVQVSSGASKRKLSAGNVFYMNFRKMIVQQVKFSYKATLPALLQSAVQNVTSRLLLHALFDELLKSPEDITRNSILQEFFKHLQYLEPCSSMSSGLAEKQFFLEIVQKVIILDKDHDLVHSGGLTTFQFVKDAYISILTGSQDGMSMGGTSSNSFKRNTKETLTNDCLVLIPLLFSYKLDEVFRKRVASCLTHVVTDFLLVSEKELLPHSHQRVMYITILERLLHVVSASKSVELLEVVFPLLQFPTKFSANRLSRALQVFGETNGAENIAALNVCYGIVIDMKQAPRLRRAIAEVVFPPLVSPLAPLLVVEWYVKHMKAFVEIFGSRVDSDRDSEQEIEGLISRICHYKIVELLYLTVEDRLLKEAITPVVPNSRLMKLANDDARAKNDPNMKCHDSNAQLWRDLHVSAYNCLAAIICRTQEQEKFFSVFLFKEGGNVGFIWQHLVDCSKVYDHLRVETGAAAEVVKELQVQRKQQTSVPAALSSQYIIGTTLSQEPAVIGSFVTSTSRTLEVQSNSSPEIVNEASNRGADILEQEKVTNSSSLEIMENEVLDDDDFDRHPSMGVILKLINHLHMKFSSHQSNHQQMPDWMKALHSSLSNSTTPINVGLFLSKVVTRFWKIFAPYAAEWFRPLVMAVLGEPIKSGGMRFHYILRDVCVCLLQWNLPKPPEAGVGSKLVNHLMAVAVHESRPVLRSNISIIRLFLNAWKDDIEVDTRVIFNYLIAGGKRADNKQSLVQRSVGLQLLGALVASGLPLHDPMDAVAYTDAELYKALLLNLEIKEKHIYEASAELVGMALKQRQEANFEKDEQILEVPLKKAILTFYKESQFDRYLNVLNKLTLHCPELAVSYVRIVIDLVPQLHGLYKTMALDILLRSPDSLRSLCSMIVPMLSKLFAHRDEFSQLKSLLVLSEILQDVAVEVIREKILPILCTTFSTHESLDCRERFYDVLIYLYNSKGLQDDNLVLHYLLSGLCEGSDRIRDSIQSFWHSKLPADLALRFRQLLSHMYDPELEEEWAQYVDVLLLQLCQESVDYRRPIFEAPLSDCEFYEQSINTSWLGGSLPMTPLFSGTQASLDLSQKDANPQTMGSGSTKFMRQPGMIRGTMTSGFSLSISQSQGAVPMKKVEPTESSLIALSQRPTGDDSKDLSDETAKLKRIYQPSIVRASAIRGKQNANRRREARSAQQALERSNKVEMMRRYRVGELPDIEIKHEEVIAPLAALAARDKTFAQLTLRILCRAVLSLPTNQMQDVEREFKDSLKNGIENALKHTNHGISFVSCLNSICLEDPSIWIMPKLVGCTSSKSSNFHSGILLLENQLCHQAVPLSVNSSKRHKGKAGQVSRAPSFVDEAWVALAQLYEAISEPDIVLALYQKHVAKQSITKLALEAQLEGDHSRALALYDKCLDKLDDTDQNPEFGAAWDGGQVSNVEIQLWDRQRHACMMELNNWQTLVDETLLEIGSEPFDEQSAEKLWDVKYKEPYLNLFVKGTAKLTSYHSYLMKFVQLSLENSSRGGFLVENFGTQLLHLAVANDQFDRAELYLSECYKNFRKHWTALHPLATGTRHLLVQQLQKIVEHEEFVEFIKSGHDSDLQRLLMKWRNRWPSAQASSVEAWDDTVNNRLLFYNKIQGLANRQLGPMAKQVAGQSGMVLAAQLDAERAHVYHEAGRGLIRLGAFGVAKGFMQDCQALRSRTGKEDYDYQAFKGLVKLQTLQANRIQHVDLKEAINMRKKVLQYIQHTAKNVDLQGNPSWRITMKLSEANVLTQIAWSSLELLAASSVENVAFDQSVGRLGSAFSTYEKLRAAVDDLLNTGDATLAPRLAAKASYKFGMFCDELLKATKDLKWGSRVQEVLVRGAVTKGLPPASAYPSLIMENLGKAVHLDCSLEAQQSVARLISVVGQYPHTQQEFQSLAGAIPTWLFVAWIPQLLATMDEEVGDVMVRVLEDIAKLYPQALHYAFQVSKGDFGAAGQRRTEGVGLHLQDPVLQGFARALEDLTFPEQRLQDSLSQIKYSLLAGDGTRAREVFFNAFQDCVDIEDMKKPTRLAGDYNLKFAENYSRLVVKAFGDNGGKLLGMDEAAFSAATKDLVTNLNKAVQKLPAGNQSLAGLSRWMAEFDGSQQEMDVIAPSSTGNRRHVIEIPGQYNGFSKPDPEAHVKLVGFEQTVVTLSSKQRPKILTMRGSDEKEYKFVVKGGEDLRLDQRIEQLFGVMNSILRRDPACSRRGLSVSTFAVVPVSRRCGLLQFVEHTRVLQDVIKDGLSTRLAQQGSHQQQKKAADNLLQKLTKQYVDWITEQGASPNLPACYHKSYSATRHDQVAQELTALQSQMPWDSFRLGMSRLSTSAEAYLSMRSQFARSLAVVSICGYVAGVGDRHLGNMLVDMHRGSLVPIDFGYSFGTAVILLPVPELIPFRLTRQLVDYLLPLDAISLLKNDMVRAMSALHESRDVLGAVLDIFVKEPLVDWKTEASRTAPLLKAGEPGYKAAPEDGLQQLGEGGQPSTSHEQQHVELKIETAHRKLDLWNPAEVTVSELRSSVHADKPYVKALESIVRGDPARNIRARVTNVRCQSVQEQVDCLIDLATDPNVYGRTWVGWQPWV